MKRSRSPSVRLNVSPPPVKRKVESTTTSKAVASFFKPASQKPPEKLTWRIINLSLIVGKYTPTSSADEPGGSGQGPPKVAAFDLDDTLITSTEKAKFKKSATGWKWWHGSIPDRLRDLHRQGYIVVILSNQGNISLKDNPKRLQTDNLSLANFKDQVTAVLRQLDLPISVYAASGPDRYRKPRTGMWEEFLEDQHLAHPNAVDLKHSFYIGDAAGRAQSEKRRKDHACSDRDLAANIGIEFQTPDEFFLKEKPEPFARAFDPIAYLQEADRKSMPNLNTKSFTKRNLQDLVIFCGSPGAGKSTFYWDVLKPLGYERVNQDILKTRPKCIQVARDHLVAGRSVAVDNTNATVETRAHWIRVAQDFKIPIRCIFFTASTRLCEHNDAVRAFHAQASRINPEARTLLPGIAFSSFLQRFAEPSLGEGFQDIIRIDFRFEGDAKTRRIWSQHWVSKFST